jgi:MerR family transcriptional regulator, thiopeptide resistance regulator
MYRIRQLAAKYGLTRTSLLHYDSIGLLAPSTRSEAGYRLYSEEDEKRLQNILLFRSMGISLDSIRNLLEHKESNLANALMVRLSELNRKIEELRRQQKNIIDLFKDVTIFERILTDGDRDRIGEVLLGGIRPLEWHEMFESMSPDLHREFLALMDLVPPGLKESIRAFLSSLPVGDRQKLEKIISRE